MIGYGPEDTNFVLELTYNYGIRNYERGNDFNYIRVLSNVAHKNLSDSSYLHTVLDNGFLEVADPDGYKFLVGKTESNNDNILSELSLYATNLQKSKTFWSDVLLGKVVNSSESNVSLRFDYLDYFSLNLVKSSNETIHHSKAYGRVAFSCPTEELQTLQKLVEQHSYTILTPFIQLDTPGKATVSVVILADTGNLS
jgi:hypothetical protein